MMSDKIRIVVVDDHVLFREGLIGLLNNVDGFEVVGEASNGQEAIETCLRCQPDLVLLDINLPILDGVQVAEKLSKIACRTKIVMLTMHDDHPTLRAAFEAGALNYLLKDATKEVLVETIRKTHRGCVELVEPIGRAVVELLRATKMKNETARCITRREREILELVCLEKSNAEIAKELFVSVNTVKNHIRNIMEKLDIRDRIGLRNWWEMNR